MLGLVPGIHVFARSQGVDGRDIRAFTSVFDGLCPAMTLEMRFHVIGTHLADHNPDDPSPALSHKPKACRRRMLATNK